MYSTEYSDRCLLVGGSILRTCCRSVVVLYSMMCLTSLLDPVQPAAYEPRCGTELISVLEFVCGERGIYIEKVSRFRPHYRTREHRIADQCCKKGCSLNYMETFCNKPKKSAQHVTPTPQLATEQRRFQTVFHRRLEKHLEMAIAPKKQTLRDKTQRQHGKQDKYSSVESTEHPTSTPPPTVSRSPLLMTTQR